MASREKKAAMPYDATYRDQLLALQSSRSTFMDELHRQQQTLRRQYTQQTSDLRRQEPYAFQDVLNNYGGRGMLHSSGYQSANQRLSGEYARQFSRGLSDYNFQRGQLGYMTTGKTGRAPSGGQLETFMNNYTTQKDLLRRAATRRLSNQAGELGLG